MEEIDIKNYAGDELGQAAVDQLSNSYQQETQEDFPVQLQSTDDSPETEEATQEISKQEFNFKALRDEVDRIKAEKEADKREYQVQLEMLRANLAQNQSPQQKNEHKMFEGLNDNDVPNVAELRREWEMREANYQARLEELQIQQTHPDYAEVIEKYAIPLVKQKPHLAEGIQGARNKALFAYELGKMAQQMQQTNVSQQKSESAQRIVENARKPSTLSSAGGQGALSKADYYATMSDQEFIRMASKNLEGI